MRLSVQTAGLLVTGAFFASGCYENFSEPVNMVEYSDYSYGRVRDMTATSDGKVLGLFTQPFYSSYNFWMVRIGESSTEGETWNYYGGSIGSPRYFYDGAIQGDESNGQAYMVITADWNSSQLPLGLHTAIYDGDTWDLAFGEAGLLDQPTYDHSIAQDPSNPNTLVCVSHDNEQAFLIRSNDRGVSWSDPVVILLAAEDWTLRAWDVEYLDDGTLVVLYSYEGLTGYPYWYTRRSFNDGQTWEDRVQVNTTVSGVEATSGALENVGTTALHAVWGSDENIKHNMSEDGGASWGSNSLVRYGLTESHDLIAAGSGYPLLWSYRESNDDDQHNMNYHQYDGADWSAARRVNNLYGEAGESGGIACSAAGTMVAGWSNMRRGSRYSSSGWRTVASHAQTDRVDDYGIQLAESTLFATTRRLETITFDFVVGNYTAEEATVDAWVTYRGLSNPISGVLHSTRNITLAAEEERTVTVTKVVPKRAPWQTYELTAKVGKYSADVSTDTDAFDARVAP